MGEKKKLKWLLVTNFIHDSLLKEDCLRTGLYAWIPAFEGEVRLYQEMKPEDFKKYDIKNVADQYLEIFNRAIRGGRKNELGS